MWQGIEKFVLEGAKGDEVAISVFTGPVFGANDPEFRGVQVPLRFWKILARVEDGQLLATGFLADQSGLVLPHFEDSESAFDDTLGDVAHFQVPIKEIEKLTDLRFDSLKGHDTFVPDGGEALTGRRLIRGPQDIQWGGRPRNA